MEAMKDTLGTMLSNDPERPCGYCGCERFMHEHFKPVGILQFLFVPSWFAGKCATAGCDCETYIYGHSYRKEQRGYRRRD